MERLSCALIEELKDAGIPKQKQSQYLADLLEESVPYVRARLNGNKSWTFAEAEIICRELDIPDEDAVWLFGWKRRQKYESQEEKVNSAVQGIIHQMFNGALDTLVKEYLKGGGQHG